MSRFDPSTSGSTGQTSATGQLRETGAQVGQSLREMGTQVKNVAQEQLGQIKQSATEYYQQGREKAMVWEQSLEDYVREQPVKSILIAAGVGVFLGFFWRRR
jgi:ElaB/YqjD/DUF883 family membrane-anchored ribosome-binding protein